MTMSDNSLRAYVNVYLYILPTNNNNSNNSRVVARVPVDEIVEQTNSGFLLYVHNIILAMFSCLQVTINFFFYL